MPIKSLVNHAPCNVHLVTKKAMITSKIKHIATPSGETIRFFALENVFEKNTSQDFALYIVSLWICLLLARTKKGPPIPAIIPFGTTLCPFGA